MTDEGVVDSISWTCLPSSPSPAIRLPSSRTPTDLTVDQLQRIAREFNQSETTFLLRPMRPDADWRLRSFTAAGAEGFGSGGHNSLGAWWWLAEACKLTLGGDLTGFHQEIGDRVSRVAIAQKQRRLASVG